MFDIKKINKLLKLDKPLVLFDIETTGKAISQDRIIQMAYTKIWPNGRVKEDLLFFDPEMDIEEDSAGYEMYIKDLRDKPKFREKHQEIWEIFNDSYCAGHNILSFDLPILRREFIRCGVDFEYDSARVIDTRIMFKAMVPRSLGATYEYYCRKKFNRTHDAQADMEAVLEILSNQLVKYKEMRDINFIKEVNDKFSEDVYEDNARNIN